MKYKVNYAEPVNTLASKTGYKWKYRGKVDDWTVVVERFHEWRRRKWTDSKGIRVTDENGVVLYEYFDN
jgi:hypothetical protein